ncbi:dna-binding response regulator [hydrocarbon metagenome]|uniref:Dna-binding response regulator n=1 Tax=hydrocarbon metagenome TaxID=938273 RepID=A0A0W8E2Y4_9ZZZZ
MKLLLIDDHPLVLQGISSIMQFQDDMEVVGTACSAQEGLTLLSESQPDIVIVDLRLAGETGLDFIRQARSIPSVCRFIILSSSSERVDVKQALNEKVDGYILKEAMPDEIVNAVRLVARGRNYIDPALMQNLICQEKDPIDELTPRELEVLDAIASGMSNREIANSLFVTEYTVKKHVSQILDKLKMADRTQAALYAFSRGFGQVSAFCS